MTDQEARYDRIAEGYAAWWSPIHRPATLRLLDVVAAAGGSRSAILDVGCGTGALASAAATRWPEAAVTGADISESMLEIAAREMRALPAAVARRLQYLRAPAERLPFGDRAFDVVVTAFVLQLVPSRPRALREARRVLRPGGLIASVTWLRGGSCGADDAYDAALAAHGFEPRGSCGITDDLASPDAAAAQLRRAGFSGVRAQGDELVHQFTPEGYLGFVSRFDDEDLFATMDPVTRRELEAGLLERPALDAARRAGDAAADRLRFRTPVRRHLTTRSRPKAAGAAPSPVAARRGPRDRAARGPDGR